MLVRVHADHETTIAKYKGGHNYNVSEELGGELIALGKAVCLGGQAVEMADARPRPVKPKKPKK